MRLNKWKSSTGLTSRIQIAVILLLVILFLVILLVTLGTHPGDTLDYQAGAMQSSDRYVAIILALLGAVSYGIADFLGGLAARRIGTSRTAATTQLLAAIAASLVLLIEGSGLPIDTYLFRALGAGLCYAFAVSVLYFGFANGHIGVVAPVCGLFSILIPCGAEHPSPG
jgi:hypothetical protein